MPLRSIAFLLYFFGSSTATLVWPMVGLVCYVALYHLYPQTTWWGKPLEPLGIRYAFVCGTCLVIGTAITSARMRMGRHFLHPVEVGAIIVYLSVLLTLVTGVGLSNQSLMLVDKMGKVLLFLLIMSHVLVSRHRLWMFALVLTLMVLYLGHEARNAPPSAFHHNRLDGIGGPDFRESAGLAIHLCALMPFVAVVLWQKRWLLRITAFFAAAYGVNAILLCRARSAFVAALAAGVMAVIYAPKRWRRSITVLVILAGVGGFLLSDTWFWKRMDTIVVSGEESRDESAAIRLQIWAAAWEMFKTNPFGVGVGQFHWQVKRYSDALENTSRDAHNSFVLCAGELGVVGLLAYVGTLGLAWMTLNQVSRQVRRHVEDPDLFEWLVLANRLALVVYVVAGLFVSRFYTEGMWWLVIMPVCLSRAVENECFQEANAERELLAELEAEGGRLEPALAGVRFV